MYKHEIFLTIEDMKIIMGTRRYQTARVRLRMILDCLGTKEQPRTCITIREFCDYERFRFEEIWKILRKTPVPPPLTSEQPK